MVGNNTLKDSGLELKDLEAKKTSGRRSPDSSTSDKGGALGRAASYSFRQIPAAATSPKSIRSLDSRVSETSLGEDSLDALMAAASSPKKGGR